ncbi:hypothetical protein FHT82_002290 [Rhizobium sp. BK275]|nr:hypothetical protein [Rhizobium sp. BK275]
MTDLAFLWCLANKNASTVILGASRASQLQDNLAAVSHESKLTSDVLDRIDSIVETSRKHRVVSDPPGRGRAYPAQASLLLSVFRYENGRTFRVRPFSISSSLQ